MSEYEIICSLVEKILKGYAEFFAADKALTKIGIDMSPDALEGHYFGIVSALEELLKNLIEIEEIDEEASELLNQVTLDNCNEIARKVVNHYYPEMK